MANSGIVFICCVVTLFATSHGLKDRDNFLMTLNQLVESEQVNKSLPYAGPQQFQQLEGMYKTAIRFNFHGKCEMYTLRHTLKIPDVQAFVSNYVALQLFDAHRFGKAPKSSLAQIQRTVLLGSEFHDKNIRYENSAISFYLESYNRTTNFWYTDPVNIEAVFKNFAQISPMRLQTILLGPAPLPDGFDKVFTPARFIHRMRLPSDFDSTSVHLCFGSLLYEVRDAYPEAWKKWSEDNKNITSIFGIMKQYAYRPFSSDRNSNTIDPRGYMIMRGFIEEAKKSGRDLAILATWIQNIDELRTQYYTGKVMPYGINTIDIGVQANFLSGVFSGFSSGLIDIKYLNDDPDFELLLNSTASLLVYELKTNLTNRYDLALLYYPSKMQFYWFASRNLMYLEKDRQKGPLVAPLFETFYQEIKQVLTTVTTNDILSQRQSDPSGGMFFDDFLGTDDLSYYDKPINRAEDRIYTTGMATNALLYIWTIYDIKTEKLRWRDNVPKEVKDTIHNTVLWLENNAVSGKYIPGNAVFGFGFKNRESVVFFYPANRFEYLNGTKINNGLTYLPEEPTVYAMEGHVDDAEYERLLKLTKFGSPTPTTFHGFNKGQGSTQFYSSHSLTYGAALLAASMTDTLEEGK